MVECLKDICPDLGNAGKLQLAALCWGLACTYHSIVSTIQHLQGEDKASGSDKQVRETVAKTEGQLSMESVAPVVNTKQWTQKSACLVREEGAPLRGSRAGSGRGRLLWIRALT